MDGIETRLTTAERASAPVPGLTARVDQIERRWASWKAGLQYAISAILFALVLTGEVRPSRPPCCSACCCRSGRLRPGAPALSPSCVWRRLGRLKSRQGHCSARAGSPLDARSGRGSPASRRRPEPQAMAVTRRASPRMSLTPIRVIGSVIAKRGVDVDIERTMLRRRIARQPPTHAGIDHMRAAWHPTTSPEAGRRPCRAPPPDAPTRPRRTRAPAPSRDAW